MADGRFPGKADSRTWSAPGRIIYEFTALVIVVVLAIYYKASIPQ